MDNTSKKRAESYLSGSNALYLYQLYKKFLSNPFAVSKEWRGILEELGDELETLEEDYSRATNGGSVVGEKDYIDASDESLSDWQFEQYKSGKLPAGSPAPSSGAAVKRATLDSVRALMLIRAYRIRGHLLASIDPLELNPANYHEELDPKSFGFEETDYDRPIFLNYVLGMESATLREVMTLLKQTYCGNIGVEFMHVESPQQKSWIQERMESSGNETTFTKRGRTAILERLAEAELFEKFLALKHTGAKRFGLDGGESLVPIVEQILKVGGHLGLTDVIVGMAHRGRLNFLANIMHKPYRAIFSEFSGKSYLPPGMGASGDVKYHLGASADREFDGNKIHISLTANPSHLEAVNTVVLGKVRAKQQLINDTDRSKVLGLLIHGDAAMAGQGIVAETFLMSNLYGYRTGGTIHLVINNQIGFTTSPVYSRSSTYCTDIAKVVGAPIFHVNGDDPESCVHVARMATEYRQRFKSDVVIDLVCYRRHGHNEADEPMFTQPMMYKKIKAHPSIFTKYLARLLKEGIIDKEKSDAIINKFNTLLETEKESSESYAPNKADWLEGTWKGFNTPADELRRGKTAITAQQITAIAKKLASFPKTITPHPKIRKLFEGKYEAITKDGPIDWAMSELLSIGALLAEGTPVRFSGEDSKRGTFSQRHAVITDQETDKAYIPLNHLDISQAGKPQALLDIIDSPLSEFGVLGFEYGFASADPHALVVWEAQFGDFVNGAQVIIDQFICSGERKWLRMNGLVMLLPHGYEGQGPEHSSARLETFLQLSAEDNWQVCNISTPANYFHALRRQVTRNFRKPLIVMSPKSLLRHKLCVSYMSDFTEGSFFHRLLTDDNDQSVKSTRYNGGKLAKDEKIKRVVLCSGKVYYDLFAQREKLEIDNIYLARVEQLYPYPHKPITQLLQRFPKAEIIWCQEEPENRGAWQYIDRRLEKSIIEAKNISARPKYIGRAAAASPATGLASTHLKEQTELVNQALTVKK